MQGAAPRVGYPEHPVRVAVYLDDIAGGPESPRLGVMDGRCSPGRVDEPPDDAVACQGPVHLRTFSVIRRSVPWWLKLAADDGCQVDEPAGVAPFVVVPAEYLGEAARGLGQAGVEDARGGIADDVAGDQRVGAVVQDAGHRACRRLLERAVDVRGGHVARQYHGEVGQ